MSISIPPPEYFDSSLIMLQKALENFIGRAREKIPVIKNALLKAAMTQIDSVKKLDCLYAQHAIDLENTIQTALMENWHKFDKRKGCMSFELQHQIIGAIIENVKTIGWWRWLEDSNKTHSLISQVKYVKAAGVYTKCKTYPVLQILAEIINDYFPSNKPTSIIILPISPGIPSLGDFDSPMTPGFLGRRGSSADDDEPVIQNNEYKPKPAVIAQPFSLDLNSI